MLRWLHLTEEQADIRNANNNAYWVSKGSDYWRMAYLGEFLFSNNYGIEDYEETEKPFSRSYYVKVGDNVIIVSVTQERKFYIEAMKEVDYPGYGVPGYFINKRDIKPNLRFADRFMVQMIDLYLKDYLIFKNHFSKEMTINAIT